MFSFRTWRRHAVDAVKLAPARPAIGNGIRGAIATVAPLLAAHALDIPEPGLVGLAGFGTAIVDKGGAYQARAATMAAFGLLGAASAYLGASVHGTAAAVGVSFLWIALCSMARAWGGAAASVGSMSSVIYLVSLANHVTSPDAPAERAAMIAAGCAWAMLLALILWPVRFYRPARYAVSHCYRGLAIYAREVAARAAGDGEPWAALFQRNQTRMHETLESARTVLATTRRGRQAESGRGERLLILLEEADQMLTAVIGLADALEAAVRDETQRRLAVALLEDFAARAERIARIIVEETAEEQVADMPKEGGGFATPRMRELAAALERHVHWAAAAASDINFERRAPAAESLLVGTARRSPLAPLLDNLTPQSIVLRHALRVGLAAAIATAFTHFFALHRGYWVTISAIVILQPYTDATFRKGMQRVAGSIAGGILAALLVASLHEPAALLVVIFVAAGVSLSVLPINYGAYATFTTPTFVLLAEMNSADAHLVRLRILNTLLGGAIAFTCARLFWPSKASREFPNRLAEALRADRRYLAAVLAHLSGPGPETLGRLRAGRRAAAVALVNLEASLQRLIAEGAEGDVESLMTLTVFARRVSVALTAIASTETTLRLEPSQAAAIDSAIGKALEGIAEASLSPGTPLSEPELPPLTRPFDRLGEQTTMLVRAAKRARAARAANELSS